MAYKTTFIKIDRNITEWRWFKDSKVFHVFAWLLIKANIRDHGFHKQIIQRGSLVVSYESIADACGMSVSSVRRAIASLEETGEIKREVRNHYQVIEILKYDEYQGCSDRTGKPQPNEQPVEQPVEQANRNNIRIYKNIKNEKNGKKKSRSAPTPLSGVENAYALSMKPIDVGTVDDIPEEFRDICKTYEEYWRLRNR